MRPIPARRSHWDRGILAALAVAAGLLGTGCGDPAVPPGGNVLLLIADDVGIDKVGAYRDDSTPPLTPHIDALAARGVRFSRAYATPSCSPSRAAMLTGRYPRRFGLGIRIESESESYELPLDEITIPEMLGQSRLGYDHSAVGKWHLAGLHGPSGARHPLDSGFRWYAGSFANLGVATAESSTALGYSHWEKNTNGSFAFTERYATSDTVDDALARIEAMSNPWFLWVAFNAAHVPLHEPPEELHHRPRIGGARQRYAAAVEALDTEIGRLLSSIDPPVLAQTTVIFLSDNGTPESRIYVKQRRSPAKNTLHERGIRVPLIVAGPLVAQPGSESDALIHVVDVFATIAEIAGVETDSLRGRDGRRVPIDGASLLPQLRVPSAPSRRAVVYQDLFGPNGSGPRSLDLRMARGERYKLIASAEGGGLELYDLAEDPDEKTNLIASSAEEHRAARERLSREIERLGRELGRD